MYLLCCSGLLVHLELFSKFTSPKSLYREAELRQLYEQVGYIFMNKNCITSSVQVVYECFNKYCPGFSCTRFSKKAESGLCITIQLNICHDITCFNVMINVVSKLNTRNKYLHKIVRRNPSRF